jgi:succinate dehydrogenase / fumarate reductase flavoprotein subunit
MRRAFGGQSKRRTYYCGSSTGKQIVSALVMEVRRYEALGLIERRLWSYFHSALIEDEVCYGAILFDEISRKLEAVCADALVMATGGQNALFGKTTGSTQCDGYAAGRLFLQGAELKNLEFIQYHPTTLETAQKRMLISEAVRGEGGRLFYNRNGQRVYFMEEKYGPNGNLMTRDIVAREMENAPADVYLDISFLAQKTIAQHLPEVQELCAKFRGIDITKEPIPVAPSVHFFMGGLAVHLNHETNIRNLFAVGECASIYHGANRLGGNSLLAALYSGIVAANEISSRTSPEKRVDFTARLRLEEQTLTKHMDSESSFPVMYLRDMLSETMNRSLGIVREERSLTKALEEVEYYLSIAERIRYDASVSPYYNYSLTGMLNLAKATLLSARARKESRGAHFRSDYPNAKEELCSASLISYQGGAYAVRLDKERAYES